MTEMKNTSRIYCFINPKEQEAFQMVYGLCNITLYHLENYTQNVFFFSRLVSLLSVPSVTHACIYQCVVVLPCWAAELHHNHSLTPNPQMKRGRK